MKAYIHRNTVKQKASASGKAIYLTARFGKTNDFNKFVWFPVSQLKIGDFNSVGWATIEIPDWIIRKNCIQNACILELEGVER